MKNMFKKVTKGVKKMLELPMEFAKEIMEDKEKRLLLGLIFMGVGGALLASVYIKVPQ